MSTVLSEILMAHKRYAAKFSDKKKPTTLAAPRFTVMTGLDTGLDPAKCASLAEGDARVIRNTGGRASLKIEDVSTAIEAGKLTEKRGCPD